jgi:serine/threonine protein kinase
MARLIYSPMSDGPQGRFEPEVVGTLLRALPDTYAVLPNFSLKDPGQQALEYDLVVLAPHAIFVIEAKEWYGRLAGDDTEWLLNGSPRKCPLWLVQRKAQVLKNRLGGIARETWVEPVFVIPDTTRTEALSGSWAKNVWPLRDAASFLADPGRVRYRADVGRLHEAIIRQLQGFWAARRRGERRRIGSYEIRETLSATEEEAEYLAGRALVEDPALYRIRTWRVHPYQSAEERARRLAVVRRPTEAVVRIGPHPNLLPILDFGEGLDGTEFYEVTPWSHVGNLHGFLRHPDRGPLTLRERLDIATGVASALEAVHARDVVHRNVCPETILIGDDRRPYLTDFDRAYLESQETVFPETMHRRRNPAYVPPELQDSRDYDFDSTADMYSFGVLLYELLTDRVPFPDSRAAAAAGGVPPKRPSAVREGVDPRLDGLVTELLNVEDFQARPSASHTVAVLREVLGTTADTAGRTAAGVDAAGPRPLGPGDILNGCYRVETVLGEGAFSRVFKVVHLDQGRTYAMKLLSETIDPEVLLQEWRVRPRVPKHPHIAELIWMDRLAPPDGRLFLLSEYVEGETLEAYCDGRKRLPWSDIRTVGTKLLDALEAMHPEPGTTGPGILHRDIKPANIVLELPSHEPKLIDFNVASDAMHATGRGGTPRYWAPDRGQPDWRADMDLFSLGVVLYELVTHRHPFPNESPDAGAPIDPREQPTDLHLTPEVARFLLKAVQPVGADRFQSAAEMRRALEAVAGMEVLESAATGAPGEFPGIALLPSERGRQDYNPYVTRLLTLYSQARRSNAGTRGLDDIARLTYVPTRLDTELTPAIAAGRFRLVIITGNAGDGKTAYLQRVEEHFRNLGASVDALPHGNGSRWSYHGLAYETNYDGSQDEGDLASDDVLVGLLAPFAGPLAEGLRGPEIRILAVNEGRLLDFLEHSRHRERFVDLRGMVQRALDGEATPSGALVVNLDLRAVTAGGTDSLLDRQMRMLVDERLWAPCEACQLRAQCPLKFNADTLRDAASGPAVRERLRGLFEIVHLRRKMHVTMRDLRSALAWLLLRDHGCEDVAELLARAPAEGAESALLRLHYPEAFAADEAPNRTVDDRLVHLLREVDVGLVNDPPLDRRLDHDPMTAVPWMTFERRSSYAREVLKAAHGATPRTVDEVPAGELLRRRRRLIQRWRRWAYFERRDDGWRAMLPYQSLMKLGEVIMATEAQRLDEAKERLRNAIVRAVSLSEGVRNTEVSERYVALRVSRVRHPRLRSYRLFLRQEFHIEIDAPGPAREYLEYAPDTVRFVAAERLGRAELRIPLDLLEMLELVGRGYRPNPVELQGLFVNLRIFRNALLNLPFNRVMLTPDDRELYELAVTASASSGIQLRLTRQPDAPGGREGMS